MKTTDRAKPFLGVAASVLDRIWTDRLDAAGQRRALALAQTHDITEIVARILAGRIGDEDDPSDFLDPKLKSLMPDPSTLVDMDVAADRLARAVIDGEKIAIFADYDVDGASSAALLFRFLRAVGSDAEIYVPDRIFEGYGPNVAALDAIRARGASLLVTVDCGVSSFEPLAHAAEIDLDVIVLDHHQTGAELPKAVAVVNPNRQDDLSGLGHLAAVGVVFMAIVATNRVLREGGRAHVPMAQLLAWLPLVALGTVCDVVPLRSLNRAFVRRGLELMAERRIAGLRALTDTARVSGPPGTYHLGFMLGPRINAGGRIGQADLGARLLALDDEMEAERIAGELERLNAERQALEAVMLEAATAEADAALGESRSAPFLLSAHEDWHPGVVGLIASRLKDRFHRPAFAVSLDAKGIGTGSARSIAGVDIGAVVRGAVEEGLLLKGGGHAMAAGFTVATGGGGALRQYLEAALVGQVDPTIRQNMAIDGALTASGLAPELVHMIEKAGPFGAGNPDPCFALPAHRVSNAGVVGHGHVRCTLADGGGGRVKAIAFRAADTALGKALMGGGGPLHVAGFARIDRWGGGARIQVHIKDAARPDAAKH